MQTLRNCHKTQKYFHLIYQLTGQISSERSALTVVVQPLLSSLEHKEAKDVRTHV